MNIYEGNNWTIVFVDWCQEFVGDCIISCDKEQLSELNDEDWKELGKISLRNQTINLDRYHYKAKTNRYRIVLDNKIVDKLDGKILKIQRNGRCSKQLINKKNNITPYRIDIVI